jgi:hypothetical protein
MLFQQQQQQLVSISNILSLRHEKEFKSQLIEAAVFCHLLC